MRSDASDQFPNSRLHHYARCRMNFPYANRAGAVRSDCGQYEMRPSYQDGAFAWRGRHVASDRLVCSSADREYVQLCCERHAAAALLEAM